MKVRAEDEGFFAHVEIDKLFDKFLQDHVGLFQRHTEVRW